MIKLINFFMFQTGWIISVVAAATGIAHIGLVTVLLILVLHFMLANDWRSEAWLLVTAIAIGMVFDSLLVSFNLLAYENGIIIPGTAPYWIIGMWALFAITLNHSLAWFQQHTVIAVLAGAVFGPLAYVAGQSLGAVTIVSNTALIVLALGWAVFFPLLSLLARSLSPTHRTRDFEAILARKKINV